MPTFFKVCIVVLLMLAFRVLPISVAYADPNLLYTCENDGDVAGKFDEQSCDPTAGCSMGYAGSCSSNQICDTYYTNTNQTPCVDFSKANITCKCNGSTSFTCGVNGSTNDFTRSCGLGEVCDNSVLQNRKSTDSPWPCTSSLSPSNVPTGYALNPCPNGICSTAIGDINVASPTGFIEKIFGILLSISGVIALILIIVSGYQLSLSQGNPEKVKNARERLTAAIIGLLFIIFSVAILQIIGVDILQLPGFNK